MDIPRPSVDTKALHEAYERHVMPVLDYHGRKLGEAATETMMITLVVGKAPDSEDLYTMSRVRLLNVSTEALINRKKELERLENLAQKMQENIEMLEAESPFADVANADMRNVIVSLHEELFNSRLSLFALEMEKIVQEATRASSSG